MKNIIKTLALFGIVSLGSTFGAYIMINLIEWKARQPNEPEEAARYISLQDYLPVGNGGALAEMNGRVNRNRKTMYRHIQESYYINMVAVAPGEVIRKYKKLTDMTLTESERQDILNNTDYILSRVEREYYYNGRRNK